MTEIIPKGTGEHIVFVPLSRGITIESIIIDYVDYHILLNGRRWYIQNKNSNNVTYYSNRAHHLLGRVLMGLDGKHISLGYVDHINCNRLDFTRKNLRVCSNAENNRNKKLLKYSRNKYKGIYFSIKENKWIATITYNYKPTRVGRYDTSKEAALGYDEKARVLFGVYGRYNFPKEGEQSAI